MKYSIRNVFFIMLSVCFILIIFSFFSCKTDIFFRHVNIIIPEHPWEYYEGVKLWYYLCYNDGEEIIRKYVSPETREISIKVPSGQTVYFCAYPLGEMHCYGGAVEPSDNISVLLLNQNEGFLTDLLLNTELSVSSKLRYHYLLDQIFLNTNDLSLLDSSVFIKDLLNGKISNASFKTIEPISISSVSFFTGTWVCELENVNRMFINDGESPEIVLPYGIFRYLNKERLLESRLVVSETGVYKHDRSSLVN